MLAEDKETPVSDELRAHTTKLKEHIATLDAGLAEEKAETDPRMLVLEQHVNDVGTLVVDRSTEFHERLALEDASLASPEMPDSELKQIS